MDMLTYSFQTAPFGLPRILKQFCGREDILKNKQNIQLYFSSVLKTKIKNVGQVSCESGFVKILKALFALFPYFTNRKSLIVKIIWNALFVLVISDFAIFFFPVSAVSFNFRQIQERLTVQLCAEVSSLQQSPG